MTTLRTTRNTGRKSGVKSGRKPGSRNKVLNTRRVRLPMSWMVMLTLIVVSVFAYLFLCTTTERLANQIKEEEQEIEQLRRRVASEEVRWSEMIGPRRLREALRKHNLVMEYPTAGQVVHIRDMAMWESGQGPVEMMGRVERLDGGRLRQ